MSRTKRGLPEDIDVTDPRDTGFYDVDEPDARDIAVYEISKAVKVLENEGITIDEAYEIEQLIKRLQNAVSAAKIPF